MDKVSRLPNETDLSYHKRLIYGKLVDGTLADEDYAELSPYVYGENYSSDTTRKMMYGSCRTLRLLDESIEATCPDSILHELDAKRAELEKGKQQYFDQRREYNKLVSMSARRENLENRLIEAANKLSSSVGNLYRETPAIHCTPDNEAVLVFSDWHYGMTADNLWNKYNTDICKQRVCAVVNHVIPRLILHSCSRLHIVVLGDLIHGAIHTSARVASEELVCEQIMNVSEILAQSINQLSAYVNETLVYVTYGNHARTVQRKEDSLHADNMERLISWWLRERLKDNPHVSIAPDSNDEFLFVDACGHGICATHGDLDSLRTSTRLLPALFQKQYHRNVEYILLADKHHRESLEELGVCAIICGALCGSDDYANSKRMYATPEQLLLILNKDSGVDAEYHIKCGAAPLH